LIALHNHAIRKLDAVAESSDCPQSQPAAQKQGTTTQRSTLKPTSIKHSLVAVETTRASADQQNGLIPIRPRARPPTTVRP